MHTVERPLNFWPQHTISLTCNDHWDVKSSVCSEKCGIIFVLTHSMPSVFEWKILRVLVTGSKLWTFAETSLTLQKRTSTEALPSCPTTSIKISNCDDGAMREAWDHLGGAWSPKMAWSAPQKMNAATLSTSTDQFTFAKRKLKVFLRVEADCGWCTRLGPIEPITLIFVLLMPLCHYHHHHHHRCRHNPHHCPFMPILQIIQMN